VVTALAVAYVVVVGASRIVLGVHYPTDLLAGWALAVGTVVAVASLTLANHGGARSDSRS
jgi:undecaprenyl-diphosphatase